MCKELKEYAEKTVKEDNVRAIRVLIENGVPCEKVSAAYPTCTDEIQKIFNEFTKKNS